MQKPIIGFTVSPTTRGAEVSCVCEVRYVDVRVHGADVRVHGADVHVHGADVHGADVRLHGADVRVHISTERFQCDHWFQ